MPVLMQIRISLSFLFSCGPRYKKFPHFPNDADLPGTRNVSRHGRYPGAYLLTFVANIAVCLRSKILVGGSRGQASLNITICQNIYIYSVPTYIYTDRYGKIGTGTRIHAELFTGTSTY